MKKSTKTFLAITGTALAGMYVYNRVITNMATKKSMLSTKNGFYYSWKLGNIFYTKVGQGKPILLVHDIDSAASSAEWAKVAKKLQTNHTVYTIDLPGCGLSDKPNITYTNFLYVQLISSFIKDVIKDKTDLVASNLSAATSIMVNQMDSELVDHLILVNPVSLKSLILMPDQISKTKQMLVQLPLIGTFIYNVLVNPAKIECDFKTKYFANGNRFNATLKDTYYEAAHMDENAGKYLFGSICGNFLNGDIRHAVKKMDKPIYLICSSEIKASRLIADEYRSCNKQIEVTHISNCKLYPQLEIPEKISKYIDSVIMS